MSRPSVNITPGERVGRVSGGALVAVLAVVLLTSSAPGPVAVILELLLLAAGLDLVVTGALGHCPLYARLGREPITARRAS